MYILYMYMYVCVGEIISNEKKYTCIVIGTGTKCTCTVSIYKIITQSKIFNTCTCMYYTCMYM